MVLCIRVRRVFSLGGRSSVGQRLHVPSRGQCWAHGTPANRSRPYAQVGQCVVSGPFIREGTARQTEECAGNVEHVPLQRPLLLSKARSSDSYSGTLRFDLATWHWLPFRMDSAVRRQRAPPACAAPEGAVSQRQTRPSSWCPDLRAELSKVPQPR